MGGGGRGLGRVAFSGGLLVSDFEGERNVDLWIGLSVYREPVQTLNYESVGKFGVLFIFHLCNGVGRRMGESKAIKSLDIPLSKLLNLLLRMFPRQMPPKIIPPRPRLARILTILPLASVVRRIVTSTLVIDGVNAPLMPFQIRLCGEAAFVAAPLDVALEGLVYGCEVGDC